MSKERLVELLGDAPIGVNGITLLDKHELKVIEEVADYLIAHGVIVPPCKVGDEVWVYNQHTNQIYKNIVVCIKTRGTGKNKNTISLEYRNVHGETSCRKFTWSQIGKQVFLTREEAEKALRKDD